MPRFIIKLTDGDKAYYLEWSTVVDAPVSYGLPLDEFKVYYKNAYGDRDLKELQSRLDRVEKSGSSSCDGDTADDIICGNRAGPNETCLTREEIIERYCRTRVGG